MVFMVASIISNSEKKIIPLSKKITKSFKAGIKKARKIVIWEEYFAWTLDWNKIPIVPSGLIRKVKAVIPIRRVRSGSLCNKREIRIANEKAIIPNINLDMIAVPRNSFSFSG